MRSIGDDRQRRVLHARIRDARIDRIQREIPRLNHPTLTLGRDDGRSNFILEIGARGLLCRIDDLFHRLP